MADYLTIALPALTLGCLLGWSAAVLWYSILEPLRDVTRERGGDV